MLDKKEVSGSESSSFEESDRERQVLLDGICSRCEELGLPAVVERTRLALHEKRCEDVSNRDTQILLQRILFDNLTPTHFNDSEKCIVCSELEEVSKKGFRFNIPSSNDVSLPITSSLGRKGNYFEFSLGKRLLGHYTVPNEVSNSTMFSGWTTIDYFGISTPYPLNQGNKASSFSTLEVNPKAINYSLLLRLLHDCTTGHKACKPSFSPNLASIHLIDVDTRTLVPYPSDKLVDYVALSYVWGQTEEKRYIPGPLPGDLPATIEDAIRVTQNLQKRYLWVDYVCIDQHVIPKKLQQIGIMNDIYSSAFATILSLNGSSISEGLPRVGTGMSVIQQQLVDFGQGNKIASELPPLETQLKSGNLMTRGWTFQEVLLSNRRLFFTREQVHFACNYMSCPESFKSQHFYGPYSYLAESINPLANGTTHWSPKEAQKELTKLINRYIIRKLSNSSDRLDAVSGLLKKLEEGYFQEGFFFGLPQQFFRYWILWSGDFLTNPSMRHQPQVERRNENFPSWSWAGWEWASNMKWIVKAGTIPCNWCRIEQPYLRFHMQSGEEIGGDVSTHCPKEKDLPVKVSNQVMNDIKDVFGKLPPYEQILPITKHQSRHYELLIVEGTILQLNIILRHQSEPNFTRIFAGLPPGNPHEYDSIKLAKDNDLERASFWIQADLQHRKLLVENEAKKVDFLLVAFSYEVLSAICRGWRNLDC
ncbi:hypothetical protein G7Y89_g3009 [Cudoniella acicularis]|uniref:Heterokaryon incompatibility domain-containing protein n=1 Tax=Cudoniella acicularis TaxID=354080 RepID=A0A8H4W5Z4_9HELO|nr:hypothetical protein G7Y89_g3009 [Cudoniella acicularis]